MKIKLSVTIWNTLQKLAETGIQYEAPMEVEKLLEALTEVSVKGSVGATNGHKNIRSRHA